MSVRKTGLKEWPTLLVLIACYCAYLFLLFSVNVIGVWLTVPALAIVLTLHSSLQHEVLHGHPFRHQLLNELLVFPAIGLFVPYLRFKATHLTHHQDERLTDPYDDPESNYLDPVVWHRLSRFKQIIYRFNNTLLGRMVVGPVIGMWAFYRQDLKALLDGDKSIAVAYCLHAVGMVIPLYILYRYSTLPLWSYVLSAYLALSLLKIRTFLEHRAYVEVVGRTVTVEDRGFLAFLFLNNNYHSVHHTYPRMPWYALPEYYLRHKAYFNNLNHEYTYPSYTSLIVRYFLHAKDPVPHPLMDSD